MIRGQVRPTQLLFVIWTVFLLRGGFYASLFPIWEGYDEWAHFAYFQHIATHGRLPGRTENVSREIAASLYVLPRPWTVRDSFPHAITHDEYWQLPAEKRNYLRRQLEVSPQSCRSEPAAEGPLLYEAMQPPRSTGYSLA